MSEFTEAPVSFNVKIISPAGYDCMLTVRGVEGSELMPQALETLKWLQDNGFRPTRGGHRLQTGNGNAPPPPPGGTIAAPNGAPPPPPNGAPAQANPEAGTTMCGKMTVGQSKAGKKQLQFTTDVGTLRCTLGDAAMLSLLPAGWTAEHLVPGGVFDVGFRIHWKQSGRYKNVTRIENL